MADDTTLPQTSQKISASDFVSNIHKIIDDRLRGLLPYVGRVSTVGAEGYSVLRPGDDTAGLESPSLAPSLLEVNDRVMVLPTTNGFDVILGKISLVSQERYIYQLGPFARENVAGTGSFQTRSYLPSSASTFGSSIVTVPVPVSGKCVGGVIVSSEARTAGEANLGIEINGVDNVFTGIRLGSSPTQKNSDILPYAQGFSVTKGDLVQAKIVATNWAPTTADFSAWLFLVGDVAG